MLGKILRMNGNGRANLRMELKLKYRRGKNYKGVGKNNKGGNSAKRKTNWQGKNAPKGAGEGK